MLHFEQAKRAHAELDAKAAPQVESLEAQHEATKRLASRARSNDAVMQRLLEEGSPLELCTLTQVGGRVCLSVFIS